MAGGAIFGDEHHIIILFTMLILMISSFLDARHRIGLRYVENAHADFCHRRLHRFISGGEKY